MTGDIPDDIANEGECEGDDEGLDPVVSAILQTLWDHIRSGADKDLSLARLSKRASVQMSVLRRMLTQLGGAHLVDTTMEEDGRGTARLTEEGEAVCAQLFGEPDEGNASAPTMH